MAAPSVYRLQVDLFWNKNFSQAQNSQRLADFAAKNRDLLIAQGRASPRYSTYVDGIENANPENVKQRIQYNFEYLADALTFALTFLQNRSPPAGRRSNSKAGDSYRNSFMVSFGSTAIRMQSFDPSKVPVDATILIYNRQPYGRKVDVQQIGKTPLRFSTPPYLFADAVKALNARYGATLSVQRLYSVNVANQYTRGSGPSGIVRGKQKDRGRLVEYPALEIKVVR